MDTEQYLLIKLAEECTEVAQRALKAAQFGLDEREEGQELTNKKRLKNEMNDVRAIIGMLDVDLRFDKEHVAKKIEKVNRYFNYAKKLGKVSY